MQTNNKSDNLTVLNILAFIPFFGYLIALFCGASKFNKEKPGSWLKFIFRSGLCLLPFAIVLFIIMGVVVKFGGMSAKIQLIVVFIAMYIAFVGAAICSNFMLRHMLKKLRKQTNEQIENNLY